MKKLQKLLVLVLLRWMYLMFKKNKQTNKKKGIYEVFLIPFDHM